MSSGYNYLSITSLVFLHSSYLMYDAVGHLMPNCGSAIKTAAARSSLNFFDDFHYIYFLQNPTMGSYTKLFHELHPNEFIKQISNVEHELQVGKLSTALLENANDMYLCKFYYRMLALVLSLIF